MAEKMEEPIFHVCGWVNSQISITVARLYSHIISESVTQNIYYTTPRIIVYMYIIGGEVYRKSIK